MYVKIANGAVEQFPYTLGDLRRDNPNTSFPKNPNTQTLESFGMYAVTKKETPSYDYKTQKLSTADEPVLEDGNWVLVTSVQTLTTEEKTNLDNVTAEEKRTLRDNRIAETDWWASSDLTMTAEQTAYRQALRDITTHANWPHLEDADWPTKP